MTDYILSIDQGTTSSRAIIFDIKGNIISSAQQEFPQIYPQNGWVEHNPQDIWRSVLETCQEALRSGNIAASAINSIGITNQRETTLLWDRQTGEPVYNAIVWQDRRTSEYCQTLRQELEQAGKESLITAKTGLLLDPYFSATKLKWLLDNVEGVRARAEAGELAFGTVDTFLLWHLTGGQSHKTDATNASRTMMFNIHQQCWDEELLTLLDIPKAVLPEVLDSAADFGTTQDGLFDAQLPVLGIAGDQQAALFGQACFETGSAKSTYGTGCFLMVNTGDEALTSQNKLLTTVGYRLNGKVSYALEGSIFVAGAVVQWLRDGIKLLNHASESEGIAAETALDHGVYLVPAFTGLGAPHWDPDARGGILGLTRASGIAEIISAGLQSVCYQTCDLLEAMNNDGIAIEQLKVDGGMVANNWLLQFLADTVNTQVSRPQITETTALGAAFLAGLQSGLYQSQAHIKEIWQLNQQFEPKMDDELRSRLLAGWHDAVQRVLSSQN